MSSPLSAEQSRLTTASLVILAAAAITAALAYTRAVMVPFVLAIFLSYLLAPLVEVLRNRMRVPRPLAVFCALLVAVGLLTLLGVLITTSTKGLLASADIYQDRLIRWAESGLAFLARLGVDTTGITPAETIRRLPLPSLMRGVAETALGLVTSGALVLIFLIYLLSGRRHAGQRSEVSAEIDRSVRRYIVLKVGTSAVTGILVGVILSLFGLDLAIVFGILAFFLNFIPSIGSIIATLLPIPIAVLQFDGLWPIIGVVALPGLVQMGIGNGLEPVIMGQRLDLHPITVLLALLFWGLLWGVVGMLLAAPMTAILRIVLDRVETTRPMANLLAGRLPWDPVPT
jgi:AI-2 transport protein TqsA